MAKSYRFKKGISRRSGFEYLERELVYDEGVLVGPDEYDTPPPSNLPLGGEGGVNKGEYFRETYQSYGVTSDQATTVVYLKAADSISFFKKADPEGGFNFNQSIIYISGSNSNVNLSSNPQITRGSQGDFCTIECVGSSVLLESGNGLSMVKPFNMDSGALITFIYTTGGNVWREVSRSHKTKSLGGL